MSTRYEERMGWWREAKFGMFIHWGLYSLLGRGEWTMLSERIPPDEYAKLADQFRPERYNPEEWVKLAKEAGMKYMVLTTRHHDGFSLFDSKVSDFTSVKTAAKRDLIAEYVSACRKLNMKIGFYYSLIDWRWPVVYEGPEKNPAEWKKLVNYIHKQVEELCTQYGKIDILWYDGCFYVNNHKIYPTKPEHWDAKHLNKMVRELQPEIIINNRSGQSEDFDTPEQKIEPAKDRLWEACMTTTNHWWGYHKGDFNYKPTWQLIQSLVDIVSKGGNLLLNIGPKANGEFPGKAISRLKGVGLWMNSYAESIYGTSPAPPGISDNFGRLTTKSDKLYLHVFGWPGREMQLLGIKKRIKTIYLLPGRKPLNFRQKEKTFVTGLPMTSPDKSDSVLVINFQR